MSRRIDIIDIIRKHRHYTLILSGDFVIGGMPLTQNLGGHKFKEVREVEKRGRLADGTGHTLISTDDTKCPLEHDK
jgi:hypothetical protein